jgi:hypothetical protein
MGRKLILTVAIIGLAASLLGAQRGGRGAAQGITRGADQPNQNKWNAKSPWGRTERSAPLEAQRKDPFKLFDKPARCSASISTTR